LGLLLCNLNDSAHPCAQGYSRPPVSGITNGSALILDVALLIKLLGNLFNACLGDHFFQFSVAFRLIVSQALANRLKHAKHFGRLLLREQVHLQTQVRRWSDWRD
jgi:hypothetical protein